MPPSFCPPLQSVLFGILAFALTAAADQVIPPSILEPRSAAEAWNVIRLVTRNVDQLLEEQRLPEIPNQISFCSPALRTLPRFVDQPAAVAALEKLLPRAFVSVNAIAGAAMDKNPIGSGAALASLRTMLDQAAVHFDAKTVRGDIFICPMHPDVLSADAQAPCTKCGMGLLTRRIPYSFIYTKPGEPSIRLKATASAPIEAGKRISVKVMMRKADQTPVRLTDLMVMHTEPIHLLIEEPGLGDYHHQHPVPTEIPGEYEFSFIPKKTAPYRIWADIVPVATGTQELPFVDLPSPGKAEAIEDTENRFISLVGGYQFALTFTDGKDMPTKVGHARNMAIKVTDSAGHPTTKLEPVMNAFSHLVGFYEDYRTVVHLHPTGGDVLDQSQRGGPTLGFILFAPRAGFMRLYCQVSIDGRMLFAPFNVNVEP